MTKVLHDAKFQVVAPMTPRVGTRAEALQASTCFGHAGCNGYRRQAPR